MKTSTEQAARRFMPKDQFELHINMTPGELRNLTVVLMSDFARQQVAERERQIADELDAFSTQAFTMHGLAAYIDRLRRRENDE